MATDTENKTYNDYLTALYEITLKISSKLDLNDLLTEIIKSAQGLVETADIFLYLYNPDKKVLVMKVVSGFYKQKDGYEISVGAGLAGKVLRDNKAIAIQDYQNWEGRLPDTIWDRIGSIACAPIISRNEPIGVIGIIHEVTTKLIITDYELDIISKFSALTSIAITNAKLYAEIKAANVKIKTLSGLLPICAGCKKIRDDKGYWNQIENYISEHSEAEFSHSLCNDCIDKLYPSLKIKL